jgi:hypothetical protein
MLIPNVLFSQILNQNDIDIWVDNTEEFGNILDEYKNNKDNDWENYLNLVNQVNYFFANDVDGFKDYFQALLDCKVPNELKVFFRSIGWENDGHKKFWTILFGSFSLAFKQIFEDIGDNNNFINEFLSLFDKDDLEIINKILQP